MAKRRVKLEDETAYDKLRKEDNLYFTSEKEKLEFTSSGCGLLDNVLSGGYVLGRMINIVGDKSTAKTALATEGLTNFCMDYPKGKAAYRETEEAYDMDYAQAMGAPVDDIDFGDPDAPITTIEAFARDLERFCDDCIKDDVPGMYVLDSYDGLSDEKELEREIGDATYGMAKAKMASELFRKLTKKIGKARVCLVIVSQVRDNINVSFGEKHRRAGGKALDFYATHILWLSHKEQLKRTIRGVERVYGIGIKALCKKNKVGFPFRSCDMDFIFGYGIDDLGASLDWLKSIKRLKAADIPAEKKEFTQYRDALNDMSDKEFDRETRRVNKVVRRLWNEIEDEFIPKRRKYG